MAWLMEYFRPTLQAQEATRFEATWCSKGLGSELVLANRGSKVLRHG